MIPLVLAAAKQFAPDAPDLVFAPAAAADHVVTMQIDLGARPENKYQEVIMRVVDRFRAERILGDGIKVIYSNVKSRVSISTYPVDDRPINLTARRAMDTSLSRYNVTNTGDEDTRHRLKPRQTMKWIWAP
jgi:hypothetical protein